MLVYCDEVSTALTVTVMGLVGCDSRELGVSLRYSYMRVHHIWFGILVLVIIVVALIWIVMRMDLWAV